MSIRYYDVGRNWTKKIAPLVNDRAIRAVLVRDFNKFTVGRCGQRFKDGDLPSHFETCDWDVGHRGKRPKFWDYVRHSACHWLVNFNLKLAESVSPKKPWRILTSDFHSAVYDGREILFDMNFLALGVTPEESYKAATSRGAIELPPGEELQVHFVEPSTPQAVKLLLEEMGVNLTKKGK
jgi:hypothetical protein